MKYMMIAPYFFCGQDLSDCPTKEAFLKLLAKKVAKQTGITPRGLVAQVWDNSHAQYVIAQLGIKDSQHADQSFDAIKDWFWDKKNQMLKFAKVADY